MMKLRFNLPVIVFILLTVFVQRNQSAPALEDEDIEGGGCYYMFNQYSEGDRILTQEPCLNCTCHNSMLMCYLRVCPFTKPIGQDCTIEKKSDQCCPVITCPEVPVLLLSPSTSTSAPSTTIGSTALSSTTTSSTELALLEHGCQIGEKYYPDGAQVVSDYEKPCELCYCIRNRTACVMQECILHVEGCTPIFEEGVCCPVRYKCDGVPEIDSTTLPFTHFIGTTISSLLGTSTTGHPGGCYKDGEFHADGSQIQNLGEAPCEHCYCMRGEIVCAVQECGAPLENEAGNCTAIPPRSGLCCPEQYSCISDDSRDVNELEESSIVPQKMVEKRPEGVEAIDDEVTEETLPLAEPQSSTIKEVIELIENQTVFGEHAVEEKAPVVEPASTEKISNYVEDQNTEREQPSPLPETTVQYAQEPEQEQPEQEQPEQEQLAEEPQKAQDEDTVKTTQNPKVGEEPIAEPEANVSEEILSQEPEKATTEYVETEPSSSSSISQVELAQTTKSSITDSKPVVVEEQADEVQAATTIRAESNSSPGAIVDSEPQVDENDDQPKTTVEPIVPVVELVENDDVKEAQKPEVFEEQAAQTTTYSTPVVNEAEPEKVESAEQDGQVQTTTTESQQVFLSEKDQGKEEKEPITSATFLPEPLPSLPDEGQGQETTLSSILSLIGDSLSQIKDFVRPQEVVADRVNETHIGEMMPEPEKLSDRSTVPPTIQIGNEIVIVGEDSSESSSQSANVHITTFRPFVVGEKEQVSEEIVAETSTHKEIISSSSAPTAEQTEVPTTEKEVQELTSIDWSLKVTTSIPTTTATTTTENNLVTVEEEEQHPTTIVSVSTTSSIPAEQPEEKDQTTTHYNQIVQDDDDEQFASSTTGKVVEQSTSASNEIASTESSSTSHPKDHEHHEHHEEQESEEPISSSVSESASSSTSTEHSSQNTVENVSEESSSTGTGSVMLTHEDNVATTDESEEPEALPPPKPIRVPGEGSCFVEGKTYKNGSRIPPSSPCQLACACQNSIVHCLLVHCQPPPSDQKSCRPVYTPGICCPSYECIEEPEQQTTAPEIIVQEPEQPEQPESSAPVETDINEVSSPAQDKVSNDQSIDESIKTVVDGGEEQSPVAPINQDEHIVIEKDNEIVSIVPDEPQIDLKTNATSEVEPSPVQEPENPIVVQEIDQPQTPAAEETDIDHQSTNTENELDHLHHHHHQQPHIQTETLVPAPPVNQEMAQNIEALTQMLVNDGDLDHNEYIIPNAESQQQQQEQQTLDLEQESIDRKNILQAILNMSETSTTSSPHYPVTMTTSMSSSPAPVTNDHSTTSTMTPMTSGACLFDGKVYMSAQQIPRSDPCDFCFCFRGDIICLQQSCPPPIPGCYEEPIPGFCCPRYECPVGSGNSSNVQTHFPPSFYHNQLLNSVGSTGGSGGGSVAPSNIASGPGCEIQGEYFETGQIITSTSGPCLECRCGATGLMECDPRECQPEPMLRKMIAAITSR